MSNIYIMEAANLFCGDDDPTASKHLTLTELQLPNLQEMYQDHHPGGSRVQIEVAVGIQKLEASFKLAGWDPDLLTQFGLGARALKRFTAYGVVRNKRTGTAIEAKAVLEGRLGRANPEAFQRGEMQGYDYAINEIMHYELHFEGEEKFYWDFFTTDWRVDGASQNADERSILRIPNGF
ncbi:phage major tail tube protein [Oricola sp.]|uniref:phage major tail tube protein n=1 Tax=Oricola sp. TaxID=1979950 RepID=UPI0025F04BFA|nr:phage major tail tube protein [Oricola sp.]MCI5078703.1 phage major tail tube protein [Oricola sp.]